MVPEEPRGMAREEPRGVAREEPRGVVAEEPRGMAPGLVYPNGLRMSDPTLFSRSAEPLAARMRPRTLEEFLGQEHLLGPGKALGELIRRGDIGSCVFWGPPGSGKTTLARIIARYTARHFEPFSAVTEGGGRGREVLNQADGR